MRFQAVAVEFPGSTVLCVIDQLHYFQQKVSNCNGPPDAKAPGYTNQTWLHKSDLVTQIREGAAVPSSLTWDLKGQRSTFQNPAQTHSSYKQSQGERALGHQEPTSPKGKFPSIRRPKPKQVLQRSVFPNFTQRKIRRSLRKCQKTNKQKARVFFTSSKCLGTLLNPGSCLSCWLCLSWILTVDLKQ